jgi:hypothetical protein
MVEVCDVWIVRVNIIIAGVKAPGELRSAEYCSSVKEREHINKLMKGWAR